MIFSWNSSKFRIPFTNFSRKSCTLSRDSSIGLARLSTTVYVQDIFKISSNNFFREESSDFLGFPPELLFSFPRLQSTISLRIPLEITAEITFMISSSEHPGELLWGIPQRSSQKISRGVSRNHKGHFWKNPWNWDHKCNGNLLETLVQNCLKELQE